MTVYAPNITSYTSRIPYITAEEYKASATGVNVSQLVPRGTPEQNADALDVAIARASSYVDIFCHQVLAATTDIQSGRYRIQRNGYLRIPTDYSPIVAVDSILVGFSPTSMANFTDMSNIWIDRKTVTIPMQTIQLMPFFSAMYADGRAYAIMTYTNGYACTLTDATSVAGATSITVDSVLAIRPGVQLTIYDPSKTEVRIVASVAGKVVTFTEALTYNHGVGVSVSALPAVVKQATVLLTSALIKTRGSDAVVLNSMSSQPSQKVASEDGASAESKMAFDMLKPFVRVM